MRTLSAFAAIRADGTVTTTLTEHGTSTAAVLSEADVTEIERTRRTLDVMASVILVMGDGDFAPWTPLGGLVHKHLGRDTRRSTVPLTFTIQTELRFALSTFHKLVFIFSWATALGGDVKGLAFGTVEVLVLGDRMDDGELDNALVLVSGDQVVGHCEREHVGDMDQLMTSPVMIRTFQREKGIDITQGHLQHLRDAADTILMATFSDTHDLFETNVDSTDLAAHKSQGLNDLRGNSTGVASETKPTSVPV